MIMTVEEKAQPEKNEDEGEEIRGTNGAVLMPGTTAAGAPAQVCRVNQTAAVNPTSA